jgi:hypothetical protein
VEVAQFTVKKHLIQNESGNLLMVIAIMGLISGLIVYWTGLTDKVDDEIRALSATQSTTFMRADFKNTIKKSLQGKNTPCSLSGTFRDKFKDFQKSSSDAVLDKVYTSGFTGTNTELKCFLNISRYAGVTWDKIKISIRRTTDPNYMTLSNFIAADILAVFKAGTKPMVLKYQMKYRIDVLTMNHFGVMFTNSTSGPLFDIAPLAKLKIVSPVLFDETNRSDPIPLANLMNLPDAGRLIYAKQTYTTAPGFSSNADVITFLTTKNIMDVFKKGIEYNQLLKGSTFKAPYEMNPTQWVEQLDFKDIINGGYPLPDTSPQAINYNAPNTVYAYNSTINHSNTADIYNHMFGAANNEKLLTSSCQKVTDISSGPYHLMIHNNLNQDFVIDFTKNIETDFPPVFCGVIAAKDLIIKLNNQTAGEDFYHHHIIGKFILKGKIKVENSGQLNLHDIMEFTEDLVEYPAVDIDITNLRTQFYNQKYFSTQNFFLPFFENYPTPLLTSDASLMGTDENKYYFPRSTKTFFDQNCVSKKCRNPNIPTPTMEHLAQTHWTRLLYEVFDVE